MVVGVRGSGVVHALEPIIGQGTMPVVGRRAQMAKGAACMSIHSTIIMEIVSG